MISSYPKITNYLCNQLCNQQLLTNMNKYKHYFVNLILDYVMNTDMKSYCDCKNVQMNITSFNLAYESYMNSKKS